MSYRSAALIAVLIAGCFDPRYGEGAACSESQTCPPGQTCDGMFCRLAAGQDDAAVVDGADEDAAPTDAADLDAAEVDAADIDASVADAHEEVDARVDATVDARADATVDARADATVDATPVGPCNARDATASASSTFNGYLPSRVNDGDRDTRVGGDYSWTNSTAPPAWVQLTLPAPCLVSRVVLYTSDLHTDGDRYPIASYQVQLWDGALGDWRTVADVVDNTAVMLTHEFTSTVITAMRILGRRGPPIQPQYVRVNELELY